MKNVRFALFDLGNVLVHIHPAEFTRTLGITDKPAIELHRDGIVSLVRQYENGDLTTEEYLDGLDRLFDSRYSANELQQAMLAVIGEPIAGMEEVVHHVRAQMPVALVSNTNELHFEYSLKSVPAVRLMSSYFLSYKLQASKPDSSYYAQVLDALGVDPSEVIFIDDLSENVEGASKAGMRGVHFRNVDDLSESLRGHGVL